MRTLLIDMPAGVAGDMLLGALVDCGAQLQGIRDGLLGLGLGAIGITTQEVRRGALMGWLVTVDAPQQALWSTGTPPRVQLEGTLKPDAGRGSTPAVPLPPLAPGGALAAPHGGHGPDHSHDHGHSHDHSHDHSHAHGQAHVHSHDHQHRPYATIRDLLAGAALPERVRYRAQRAFRLLAEAEGEVHGVPAEEVEFHEVGSLDAIADVVSVCLALEQLAIDRVVAGPFTPGQGRVRCEHGEMPVPVPAVARMLVSAKAPTRLLGWETGELTTPTGCALVLALADAFLDPRSPQPLAGTLLATGNGAGSRNPAAFANIVRCSILEVDAAPPGPGEGGGGGDGHLVVAELRTQFDDATGEQLASLMEELLRQGALDAYLTAVLMKKGRPGQLLTVLAPEDRLEALSDLVLARSSTIGVRWSLAMRKLLPRSTAEVRVGGQLIPLKIVVLPDGTRRAKPEADAVAEAARVLGRGFTEVQAAALEAWRTGAVP